jgi:hypothetical protein
LEVSGEDQAEADSYFNATSYRFHGAALQPFTAAPHARVVAPIQPVPKPGTL